MHLDSPSDYLFQETFSCLKQDQQSHHRYFLTEPHLLYLSKMQSEFYFNVMNNTGYKSTFHKDTINIIEKNIKNLFNQIKGAISLIDLGPGSADKALPIAKCFFELGHPLNYYPVDINPYFLKTSTKLLSPFAKETIPILARFEDCRIPLTAYQLPAYSMLGITFMNFTPAYIFSILKNNLKNVKSNLIAAELLPSSREIKRILQPYQSKDNAIFAFGPLANLGFSKDAVEYKAEFNQSKIESKFLIKRPSSNNKVPLRAGDEVITAISYRYTLEELETIISRYVIGHKKFFSKDKRTVLVECLLQN